MANHTSSTTTTLVRVDRVSPGYDPAAFYKEFLVNEEATFGGDAVWETPWEVALERKDPEPVPAPAPQGPVEVRVNGLPYAATEENVHKLFDKVQFQVLRMKLDNTFKGNAHAVVKLASHAEAERAISTLTGRNLAGRKGPKNLKCKVTVVMEST
ncbi:hypothetical protein PMIN06_003670 [Paraphaeosphaeria minitans]|uniref:RRM domain-containing protein n=1 Tax=Paraphaeosphaeria minitans TaxID=565426 RepID=A0A9P6GLP5_9PLEO|nr:hypothetical protein PMIN01_05315 [Paraphaeosphaeria minitans]